MRISADKKHDWYNPLATYCTVFFNGSSIMNCVTASEEDSFVEVYSEGKTNKLFGDVKVVVDKDYMKFYKPV